MKTYRKVTTSFLLLILSASLTGLYAQDETDDTSSDSTCINLQSAKLKYKSKDQNTNGEVSILQDYLSSIGLLNSQASGFYGLATVSAMKSFQKNHGLSPTGTAGPLTRKAIYAATCSNPSSLQATASTVNGSDKASATSASNPSESTQITSPLNQIEPSNYNKPTKVSWALSSASTDDITSFPLASDTWSDTLGVGVSDLSVNSSYYVIFNRLSPLSGTVLKGKDSVNSLGEAGEGNLKKIRTAANNGIRIDNLSLYYGTQFSPTKKTQYKLSFSNCDDPGAAIRVLIDKRTILSKECPAKVQATTTVPIPVPNKLTKPPVMSMNIPKEITITLPAGLHTLEVEFMPTKNNAWTGLYSIPLVRLVNNADIVATKSTDFSSLLSPGDSFDLVSSGYSTSDTITLAFKKNYLPKNLVLSTNGRNITWDASAAPSSVEKIIVLSNGSYSHVINAPATATVYPTTESLLGYEYPLDPASPKSFICNPYTKVCNYMGSIPMFLKQHPYVLKSMSVATSDTANSIEVPAKTFTDKNDAQEYFKQLTEKSKQLQLGQAQN